MTRRGEAERMVIHGDGLELAAYLFRPEAGEGDRPAIVFLHGSENGPWPTRNISRFHRDQGYVVLAPSSRRRRLGHWLFSGLRI